MFKTISITFSLLLMLVLSVTDLKAQHQLSLREAIRQAHLSSVDAQVAENQLKKAYWQYRTYKAEQLPELSLSASLPNFKRSNTLYQNQDGSYGFVRNNLMQLSGELSIEQNISLTGGKLSLISSLDYINPLKSANAKERYMSVPIGITYSQPIFGVNTMKWKNKIEPVRYKEAKAKYIQEVEEVTLQTINLYFQLLLAKENLKIAVQNNQNAKKIYEIGKARREMGQISENELLQLEQTALKAASSETSEESALKSAMFALRSYLGYDDNIELDPITPDSLNYPLINYEEALAKAEKNNPLAMNIKRRQLEADYAVAEAKGKKRDIQLFASIGYTGENETLPKTYQNLQNYQIAKVGLRIPIIDWGKRKGEVKVAESNREVVASRIKQERLDFKQNLFLLVERYNNQTTQLHIAAKADTIAQKRYDTSIKAFMVGKINILDLNDAQRSKDNARAQYIADLHRYWFYLYQLRSITLFDFENNHSLDADIDYIIAH